MNNSEWLRSLEPADLKAWFESEHGTPTTVQDVYDEYEPKLRGGSQGSQIANLDDLDTVEIIEAYKVICQCANVSTEWKPIFAAGAVIGTMEGAQKLIAELKEKLECETRACGKSIRQMQDKIDELTANLNRANEDFERARAELQAQVDELTAERDNLVDDLLICNSERERYREAFGEALDKAAEIVKLQP